MLRTLRRRTWTTRSFRLPKAPGAPATAAAACSAWKPPWRCSWPRGSGAREIAETKSPAGVQRDVILLALLSTLLPQTADNTPPEGYVALFNGKDLSGWKADDETKQHWSVKDGVLEHDGK